MAQPASHEEIIVADCIARCENAQKNRGNWENQWDQIARRILPQYVNTFSSAGSWINNQGQPRTDEMVDATGALALPKFAAAMESMLTPRNSTWHRVRPHDKAVLRNRAAAAWYDQLNQTLFDYRYAPFANFASQMHEGYMALGAFGTDSMYVDALKGPRGEKGIRYRNIHLGEIYFLENHQGIIDTAIRKFPMTARQALQKFKDKCPPELKEKAAKPEALDTNFWFIHCVRPRGEVDPGYDAGRKDAKGMPYGSYYISITGNALVQEGGYNVFPYPISRYVVAPGEIYGRSPAMMVLPAIKTLNEQKKTVLKQGHRVVDPVLLAHDDGVLAGFSLKPGAVNYGGVSAEGRPLVHALPTGNLAVADKMMELERNTINDGFLVTLFQMVVEDRPQMTATEVLERARERGIMLSPTMGRQQSEFLGPMIEREIDVLAEQGLIPEMPLIVKQMQGEYKAEYDSPLSRAQRAENAAGFMNTVNYVRDIVAITQDPTPLDSFNFDRAVPAIADISAVPVDWMSSPEEIAAKRAARAQAMAEKQAVDAAPAMASVAKALPQLKLNGQNGASI